MPDSASFWAKLEEQIAAPGTAQPISSTMRSATRAQNRDTFVQSAPAFGAGEPPQRVRQGAEVDAFARAVSVLPFPCAASPGPAGADQLDHDPPPHAVLQIRHARSLPSQVLDGLESDETV
jgi:hypothetical protein